MGHAPPCRPARSATGYQTLPTKVELPSHAEVAKLRFVSGELDMSAFEAELERLFTEGLADRPVRFRMGGLPPPSDCDPDGKGMAVWKREQDEPYAWPPSRSSALEDLPLFPQPAMESVVR